MAFVVLYDACVLYPAPLRELFIRLASRRRSEPPRRLARELLEMVADDDAKKISKARAVFDGAARFRIVNPVGCLWLVRWHRDRSALQQGPGNLAHAAGR
jgi:hypothetical protein